MDKLISINHSIKLSRLARLGLYSATSCKQTSAKSWPAQLRHGQQQQHVCHVCGAPGLVKCATHAHHDTKQVSKEATHSKRTPSPRCSLTFIHCIPCKTFMLAPITHNCDANTFKMLMPKPTIHGTLLSTCHRSLD